MPKLISLAQKGDEFSYLNSTRKRFLDEFARIREKYELNSIVLVLDLLSARFISGLFSVTELVGQGIVFIERLEKLRKILDHHAIYFITPTQKSIDFMLGDFKNQEEYRYRKAHVLFTSSLDPKFMKKISANHFFLKKLARHSFKEFYFQAFPLSDNCVHLSIDYLSLAFSKESNEELEARVRISRRFVDLVSSYDSLNIIRICYQPSANQVAERVAERAAQELKQYLTKLLDNKSAALREDAADITIYITDRSVDIITPLIHGYAYESLLYDIVNLSENQKEGTDPSKLKGKIFSQFRYRHLSHALSQLPQRLNQLKMKISDSQKLQAIEIKQLKEEKQELDLNQQLLRRMWEKFQEKGLAQLGEIELCLTTGVDNEGKQTSSAELFDKVIKIIKNSINLSPEEILRIALLTVICIRLSRADYETLINLFKQDQQKVISNLAVFGIRYDKKISKSTKAIDKTTMDRARAKLESHAMPSERFTCALEIILPRLVDFMKARSAKIDKKLMEQIIVTVTTDEQKVQPKFDEKKLICFMCGGLSQSEICTVRRNTSLSNILLAADEILTPNKFVQSLSKIDLLSTNAQS